MADEKKTNEMTVEDWTVLWDKIKHGDIEYVKHIVQNTTVDVNDLHPEKKTPMLFPAAASGHYAICSMLINLGANVTYSDVRGDTAVWWARDRHHYDIEHLLSLSEFGGSSSAKITEIISKLKDQKANHDALLNRHKGRMQSDWVKKLVEYICGLIQQKQGFDDDLLCISWRYVLKTNKTPFQSKLWGTLSKCCQDVIESSNSKNWFWFNKYILTSMIWYCYHPKYAHHSDQDEKKQNVTDTNINRLLWYELFELTKRESIKQSLILHEMEKNNRHCWTQLCSFGANIKTYHNTDDNKPRQDTLPNSLSPKYTKQQLSHLSTATFNAIKHSDLDFLSSLIMLAHMLNNEFQQSVEKIFDINTLTKRNGDNSIIYRRGPVKLMERCKVKMETDYKFERYPAAAHLLDLMRCTLIFKNGADLLKYLNVFVDAINTQNGQCIAHIVRIKNGFREYDRNKPSYADIKINVSVNNGKLNSMIAEIQFLLYDMSRYKVGAHKLYNILRKEEELLDLLKVERILMNDEKNLHIASCLNDRKLICDLLVTQKKDYNFIMKMNLQNVCGKSSVKVLKLLLEIVPHQQLEKELVGDYGGICEAIYRGQSDTISFMLKNDYFLKLLTVEKHTYFRRACKAGQVGIAQLILLHFADLDINECESRAGKTGMHLACQYGRFEVVQWLLSLPDIDILCPNKFKQSSLHYSIEMGQFEIAQCLYDAVKDQKAALLHTDMKGRTIGFYVNNSSKYHKKDAAVKLVTKWAAVFGLEFDYDEK